jgi:hypothetical protein
MKDLVVVLLDASGHPVIQSENVVQMELQQSKWEAPDRPFELPTEQDLNICNWPRKKELWYSLKLCRT